MNKFSNIFSNNKYLLTTLIVFFAVFSFISLNTDNSVEAQPMGGGGGRRPESQEIDIDKEVAVETTFSRSQDFYNYLTVSAETKAAAEVNIFARLDEYVEDIKVDVGDRVEKGDLILKLDDSSTMINIAQAEASLKSAEANLQNALNGARDEELAKLEASLEQAESTLKLQQSSYQRKKELFKEGYISQEELDQAENELVSAQSSYQNALKSLELSQAGSTAEEIASLEAQVESAAASLKSAELNQSYTEIRTPISGIVAEMNEQIGEMVSSGTTAVVTNIDQLELTAYVSESYVNQLRVGEKVKVGFKALDQEYEGEIESIAPKAADSRKSFPVQISLENSDMLIKAGMTAKLSLIVSRQNNVTIIEQDAILEENGIIYVYLVKDSKALRQEIELGMENEELAVVKSGLEPGVEVVALGKENISDGQKLNVVSRGES